MQGFLVAKWSGSNNKRSRVFTWVKCQSGLEFQSLISRNGWLFMRLNRHPLMSYRGRPTWPPQWTWLSGTYNRHPDSEAGVLENVRLSAVNYSFILLTMSCGRDRYISHLSF